MQCLGCEWVIILGFPPVVYHLQFRAGVCAVHMADAVATGEIKSYNYIARLRSLPRFAETISQGVGLLAQRRC